MRFLGLMPASAGMIILCFLVGVCGWMLAASSKTTPKPPHVVYLTNAYKAWARFRVAHCKRVDDD